MTIAELAEGIAAECDQRGFLAGIEILDARRRFGDSTALDSVTLEGIGLHSAHAEASARNHSL